MKRKLTFLLTALLLLTRMSLWGQSDNSSTYTSNVTLSTTGGTSATNCKVIISNVQYDGIKAGTGSVAGAWKVTVPAGTQYLHLHVAAWKNDNVTLTVTPSGLVSDIALTSNNGISSNSPFTFDGDPSTNDYYKVLSFSNLNQDTELTFTANSGKRFVVFGVNSESSGTIPTVASPTFSPVGGTYGNTQTVTISCATEGATIYYTTDNSDPVAPTGVTGTQYTQPLTISETTTVKAVAIKDGMNNSSIATASYTIQQIASITTINGIWDAAAQAGTTATPVSVTFNDWYVTGVKGGQVCISDGQYGFVIYQSGHGFVVGDKLNGTTTCNVLMYQNHYAEITGVSATNLTVTPGQEMPVLTTTIGSLELKNYGTPIDLGTLTFNNGQFYDETGLSITPYNNFNLNPNPVTSLETGKQYHVKGISIIYWPNNGGQTQQVAPRSADDLEEVTAPMEAVATPTFSPAEGTYNEAQTVTIACETDGATIYYTLDGTDPTPNSTVYSDAITISETTTVKAVATKNGMTDSEIASATYTIQASQSGSNYVRIADLSQLSNGDRVIIAARYNQNFFEYYAMTAQTTGKPAGVLFSSVLTNDGEFIPSSIAEEESSYYWTVSIDSSHYTFTNANGNVLGYTSSTNFATGGDNTAWNIGYSTADTTTMVPGYSGFLITNVNSNQRLIALNNNHNFGPYSLNNISSANYNFFLDLFVCSDVPTPPTPTYYAINIAQGITNGTVTTRPAQQAAHGSTVKVIATPANNYELATLTYTYAGLNAPIDIKGTKQFTMPDADVTINATFTEQQVSPTVITIAEARALALNEYATVQGVVTFLDGRNVYIQDATAGIDLYLNSNTVPTALAIGDMVQAHGMKTVYKGLVELSEINGADTTQFSILSNGNNLPLAVKTIAEVLADYNTGANALQSTRIKIVDATIGAINTTGNTPITQDGSTMNIYKMPAVDGLLEGDLVTVTGIIGCFNAAQLRVNSASDVEFSHSNILAANPDALNGFTYVVDNGPSDIKSFQLSATNLASGRTYIYPSENYEISSFGGDAFHPERRITITSYSGTYSYPFYVRLKAGLAIGNYNESITIAKADYDTIYVTCSGHVTEQGQGSTGDYIRIADLSQLGNGAQVILAARYNGNANEYYAMTAQTTGKPTGVLFTSVSSNNGEAIPSSIAEEESTYYWTVTSDGNNFTFTNANGDVLGYTSSTNFATGGDNTAWAIEFATSEVSAMVPEYGGFVITNVNNNVRAIALNSNHNFAPYHVQNMGGDGYNFFLDIFATENGSTPVCATPTFSPEGGTYYDTQSVSISCSTPGATIYYTTDGSDPTPNSAVYDEPLTVSESVTIKAIAMKDGFDDSNIAVAEYNIINGAVTIFNQDWEGDMNGWTFVTVEGSKPWTIAQYQGNHYANANGYNGGANEQWCISPAFNINLYGSPSLTFRNAMKFTGPDLELYFSNDYDGEDPTSATWTELSFIKSEGNYVWAESGVIDLANFNGTNCYIGFKYTSTEEEAAAWEIDDIMLLGFTTEPYITAAPTSLTGFTHVVDEGPSAAQTFVISGGNLPPAPGGQAGGVTITCSNNHYEFSLDGEDYHPNLGISVVGTLEPTTIYVRLNGESVGSYQGTITIEDYATATVSVSGTVTEQPIPGGDWNRIHALSDLHDGDQVIIASRYDATVGDGYYAMTASVSGKPDGVLFTSVNNNGTETLPAEITAEADTYLWNVTLDGNVITLTNAAGDALGYSTSTNFAGNTSIEWTIANETAGENAMIPNYTGFLITNAETTNRCIVMNANHKFGAYHTNNINSADYNFYLDLFVQGGSTTPTVATPVFSVASGTYYEEFDVEITCTTEDATIYYTTDGTDPTSASEVYTEAIHVDHDMTLKAIAMKEGYDNSGIAAANYVINTGLVVIFNQDWEGEMEGWTFVTVEGNKPWTIGTYAGNKYANANGYNDDADNEQWCISPAFNLNDYASQNVTLSFMNATKFDGPALELFFSNDYDGQDPTEATWQPLSYIHSEGNYEWTSSGDISLNAFNGSACYIGFKYTSTVSKSAAAWEIDDILLTAAMGNEPYLTVTPNTLTGFQHVVNAGPSSAQTFVLTGGNLPPAPGSNTGAVELDVSSSYFEVSLDGLDYSDYLMIEAVETLEPTTIYVRLNGNQIGHYDATIHIIDFVETSVTLSGDVVETISVDDNLAENVHIWNYNNQIVIENNCGSALDMAVYNVLGQPVMHRLISTGSLNMEHNLSSGLYIITLSNEQGTVSHKMVVK